MVAIREWDPNTSMYQNRKSKVVHVVADTSSFSCGIQINSDYIKVNRVPFLDIRRCKRCAAAKPIKTVGQLASALEKLRTGL